MAIMDQILEVEDREYLTLQTLSPEGALKQTTRLYLPPGVKRLRWLIEDDGTIRFFDAVTGEDISRRVRFEKC